MTGRIAALAAAVVFHLFVIFLGGLLFLKPPEEKTRTEVPDVDLVSQLEEKKPEADAEVERRKVEEVMEIDRERPPEMQEPVDLEASLASATPRLEALSLADLSAALDGTSAGGGDFAGAAASLQSGGRIGGTAPALDGETILDGVFDIADLDQKPRPIYQAAPTYPVDLRQKKVEGTVHVLFVVDPQGRVADVRIEKSSLDAFERPALEAVKQWRFEPAVRKGQKVACKMRIPIRFSSQA
jgi:protein TonB